jgi:hypothetical protein
MAQHYDLYLDGRLLAQRLMIETVEDLCKLDAAEINWAIEDCGVCSMLDDSDRDLRVVAHKGETNDQEK